MPNASHRYSEHLIILGAVVVIGVSYLVHIQFFDVEQSLTSLLSGFLGRGDLSTSSTAWSGLLSVGLAPIIGVAAMTAYGRLDTTAQKIVTLQLVALILISQTVGVLVNLPLNNALTLTVAAATGIIFGAIMKTVRAAEMSFQSASARADSLSRELLESKLQMIKEDEVERRILAGDLHDQVLNDLKVVKNKIASADGLEDKTRQELDTLIVDSMHQIREVMDSLSPAVLEHLGFCAALEDCIRVGCLKGDLKARFKSDVEESDLKFLTPTEQTLIYRLVQESVTNICKHARAKTIRGRLTADGGNLLIEISDDGVGFDASTKASDSRGLRYMRQRASIIGARVDWKSGDEGKGTRVVISMPIQSKENTSSAT